MKTKSNQLKGEKKDCRFQYATDGWMGVKIIEDTDLITREEAERLWDKYYQDAVEKLRSGDKPQMGIWINCKDDGLYNEMDEHKNIDYRDCVIERGLIFRLKKELIK